MAKPKAWTVLDRGTVNNPAGFFRVADQAEVSRWWKRAKFYSFESYTTREAAEARVAELVAANARSLDVARTLTWVNSATSYQAESNFHKGGEVASRLATPLTRADVRAAVAARV